MLSTAMIKTLDIINQHINDFEQKHGTKTIFSYEITKHFTHSTIDFYWQRDQIQSNAFLDTFGQIEVYDTNHSSIKGVVHTYCHDYIINSYDDLFLICI